MWCACACVFAPFLGLEGISIDTVLPTPDFWRAYKDILPEHLIVAAYLDPDNRPQMNALCGMLRVTKLAPKTQIRGHVRALRCAIDKGERQDYQVETLRRSNRVPARKRQKTREQQSFLCRLPRETISMILEYLPATFLQWATLVSTKPSWQILFKDAWQSFTLTKYYQTRGVHSKESKPFTASIRALASFRGLLSLHIENVHLCDEHVRVLCGIDTLQSVRLVRGAFITDKGAAHLFQLRALHTVSLAMCGTDCAITDVSVFALSIIKTLRSVNLAGCDTVTDIGVTWLARMKCLERLNLGGCHGLTERALTELSKLTSLTSLSLERCEVTDYYVQALSSLTNLQGLHLGSSTRLTSKGLSSLSTLTKLKALFLGECRLLTDECVETLLAFPELQQLCLAKCGELTDACVGRLSELPRLRVLILFGCVRITDASLRALCALRELRWLNLAGCDDLTLEAGQGLVPECKVVGLGEPKLMSIGTPLPHRISDNWWCDID
jgi:hypothetical protein